jgi:pimeloyl-ACP methyl ester carboxylesterase
MIDRLVLLPGMDGTGELFADFIGALPPTFDARVVRYPRDKILSISESIALIESAEPAAEPFVLLAESFSSPLAVRFAATNPPSLKGLILCAGFVSSPAQGWRRIAASLLAPVLFRLHLHASAARLLLVGSHAPEALVQAVRSAVSSVSPAVLSSRLRTVLACDARAELAQVNVPILYLRATQDRLVPASSFKEIQRIKSRAELTSIPGPHLLLQREPGRAARAAVGFIERLD